MNILIAGANGDIATAIGSELGNRGHKLASISRGQAPDWSRNHLQCSCSKETDIQGIRQFLNSNELRPELVLQCAGILHDQEQMPEKALSKISIDWLMTSMHVNVATHIVLAQAVDYLVNKNNSLRWVSLSAMVGSIDDNQIGGWHSYRMSKAALNMFVRNLSIEWTRRAKDSIVAALHPGTTDTRLSKPFQGNIAKGKLYSRTATARRLSDVIENLRPEHNGRLLHWDGSALTF